MTKGSASQAGWNLDNSYAELDSLFYSEKNPDSVNDPELLIFNERLANELGLDAEILQTEAGVDVFAGNQTPEGAKPLAQAYAGHQFGHFTMLGDGRALLLGEQITPEGKRLDIQLKGSGRTPYSRGGDGKAAVGPMLREYIISEAMHALKIPTTRSLAVVRTGEPVYRETVLDGAVLTRIAASHLRVGTFQYASNWGNHENLRSLADYTIARHYTELEDEQKENKYIQLLTKVIQKQAALIAKWQGVGFIHGVMNTDNMTLSGETIDYGPCAFMNAYDPETVFSSIDVHGRYAYGKQPSIAAWNLARLAEAMLPLLHEEEEKAIQLAEDALSSFADEYRDHWLAGIRQKLGITELDQASSEDVSLIKELFEMMHANKADYTNTFVALTVNKLEGAIFQTDAFKSWHARWSARLRMQNETEKEIRRRMQSANPYVIPRNYRVEEALKAAAEQDYTGMEKLLQALAEPYAYSLEQDEYTQVPEKPDMTYRTFCGT